MSSSNKEDQITMFNPQKDSSYDEIMKSYTKEFENYILPKGETTFGFWMQTLADLELLNIELQGLEKQYTLNPIDRTVILKGNTNALRLRISHLEKVKGEKTLYTDWIDTFKDTNAYAFHNLYPYKGKFYPRIVRTLINALSLDNSHLILDPFNGSGTTTHEAALMGIKSIGFDITPIGIMLSKIKNKLLFTKKETLSFSFNELGNILKAIEDKEWNHDNPLITQLMLCLFFDSTDALLRTSRYRKKGKLGLFIEKFDYIKACIEKNNSY